MAQYFDRTGRRLSEDEARDKRGIIRDGVIVRTRMTARDSVSSRRRVVTDAGNKPFGLHQPGFRTFRGGDSLVETILDRTATADAYRAHEEYLNNAWRNPIRDAAPYGAYPYSAAAEGTSCTIDGRPGRLVRQGNSLVCKPTSTDTRMVVCPDCGGEGDIDGDECERCDGEGEIDADEYGDRRTVSLDQMRQDHQRNMTRIYNQIEHDLQNAWRGSK